MGLRSTWVLYCFDWGKRGSVYTVVFPRCGWCRSLCQRDLPCRKRMRLCGHHSTGDRSGCLKYLCLYSLAALFLSIGYFAVYLPAAEKELTWQTPEGGCLVTSEGRSYECSCSTDEYGVTSCSSCRDYHVAYTPHGHSQLDVTLKGESASAYTVGEVYPRCKYDTQDFTKVDLDPYSPAGQPGFIILMVLGGLSLLLPTCCCLRNPGRYGFQKIVDPRQHRRRFRAVVLFGPPGVGKRTILDVARNRGYTTYDVTEMGNSYSERLGAFRQVQVGRLDEGGGAPVLFVAADLRRHDIPGNYETVVLKPSFSVYDKRYKQCCERRPEENAHNHRQIYNVFQTNIFHRLFAGNISPQAALDLILEPFGIQTQHGGASTNGPGAVSLAVPIKLGASEPRQSLLQQPGRV